MEQQNSKEKGNFRQAVRPLARLAVTAFVYMPALGGPSNPMYEAGREYMNNMTRPPAATATDHVAEMQPSLDEAIHDLSMGEASLGAVVRGAVDGVAKSRMTPKQIAASEAQDFNEALNQVLNYNTITGEPYDNSGAAD